MATTPRRPVNPMEAAEALFKPAKKQAAPVAEKRALPETKELVSLKLDSGFSIISRRTGRAGRSASTTRCGRR
jgi:uncharacterized protein (DUF4415 family)